MKLTMSEVFSKNFFLLSLFVRNQITEFYKRMAKDETLFKFMNTALDPFRLVDFHLQGERMALDLAYKFIEEDIPNAEAPSSLDHFSKKLDATFGEIYSGVLEKKVSFEAERMEWLQTRFVFYRAWLEKAKSQEFGSAVDLARESFGSASVFKSHLEEIFSAESALSDALLQHCPSMNRFLLKKQIGAEREVQQAVWLEVAQEAFRAPAALKGS